MLGNPLGTYREYSENMLGNPLGTYREYCENILGTRENGKTKKILPPPPKTLKEKKQGTLSACLGLPIGCMKFLFPKEFITIFGLG
jgi:hypothetical protein